MRVKHDKLHFEKIIRRQKAMLAEFGEEVDILKMGLEDLRDSYHSVREDIKKTRADMGHKKYGPPKTGEYTWISRLVLHIRILPASQKKQYARYNPLKFYQIYFYRSLGNNRIEYVERLKPGMYSTYGLLRDSRNKITLEEEEPLKYFISEVNLHNQCMLAVRDAYLALLKAAYQMDNVF